MGALPIALAFLMSLYSCSASTCEKGESECFWRSANECECEDPQRSQLELVFNAPADMGFCRWQKGGCHWNQDIQCEGVCGVFRDNLISFYRCLKGHAEQDRCVQCEFEYMSVQASWARFFTLNRPHLRDLPGFVATSTIQDFELKSLDYGFQLLAEQEVGRDAAFLLTQLTCVIPAGICSCQW
jgi:hypothetical protein